MAKARGIDTTMLYMRSLRVTGGELANDFLLKRHYCIGPRI